MVDKSDKAGSRASFAKHQSKDRTNCRRGVLTAARTPTGHKIELARTILAKGEPSTCREHDIYARRVRMTWRQLAEWKTCRRGGLSGGMTSVQLSAGSRLHISLYTMNGLAIFLMVARRESASSSLEYTAPK